METVNTPPALGYVQRLLGILADNDPIAVQSSLVDRIRELTDGRSRDAIHRPEAPGKWSVAAVVRHLADNDLVHGYRMRKIIGGTMPTIDGYDENDWARELRYLDASFDEALADLDAVRSMNLRLLASLTPEQWQRSGLHNERGEESVRRVVELIAAHDMVHIAQIARILAGA
ncbi:MAG TPA: DinB family protein [Candidatus Kapabacteria bacterium]|jgi:hypothetical protein|nr:DinB family protein [Candidatus Kapabacteria bacterium]